MKVTLMARLVEITSGWNAHDDISKEDETAVKAIGKELYQAGGMSLMESVYRQAQSKNRYAATLRYVWHGIGDWQA